MAFRFETGRQTIHSMSTPLRPSAMLIGPFLGDLLVRAYACAFRYLNSSLSDLRECTALVLLIIAPHPRPLVQA